MADMRNLAPHARNGRVTVDMPVNAYGVEGAGNTHFEFDAASGNLLSEDKQDPYSDARTHLTFDPVTGHLANKTVTGRHQAADADQYLVSLNKDVHLLNESTNYDLRTGKPVSSSEHFEDGSVRNSLYDPKTGLRISSTVSRADGHVETHDHMQYDCDGILVTDEVRSGNGAVTTNFFNPGSSAPIARDIRRLDGSKVHVRYSNDDVRQPVTVTTSHPDGSRELVEYRPGTNKPQYVTLRNAKGDEQFFEAGWDGKMHRAPLGRDVTIFLDKEIDSLLVRNPDGSATVGSWLR